MEYEYSIEMWKDRMRRDEMYLEIDPLIFHVTLKLTESVLKELFNLIVYLRI